MTAMAPAFLMTQSAAFVDLGGPLLLAIDWAHSFNLDQGNMQLLPRELCGGASNGNNQELQKIII